MRCDDEMMMMMMMMMMCVFFFVILIPSGAKLTDAIAMSRSRAGCFEKTKVATAYVHV